MKVLAMVLANVTTALLVGHVFAAARGALSRGMRYQAAGAFISGVLLIVWTAVFIGGSSSSVLFLGSPPFWVVYGALACVAVVLKVTGYFEWRACRDRDRDTRRRAA